MEGGIVATGSDMTPSRRRGWVCVGCKDVHGSSYCYGEPEANAGRCWKYVGCIKLVRERSDRICIYLSDG